MDEETERALKDLKELFGELRDADLEAVRLTREDLTRRLDGFPQQYATAAQLEVVRTVSTELKGNALSKDIYDTNHKRVVDGLAVVANQKLDRSVFNTFLENYRLDQERLTREHQVITTTLATAAGQKTGASATWLQIGSLLGAVVTILTIVILLSNHVLH